MPLVILDELLKATLITGFNDIVSELTTPPSPPAQSLADDVFAFAASGRRNAIKQWLLSHPPTTTNFATNRLNISLEYPRADMVVPHIAITVAPSSDATQVIGDHLAEIPVGAVEIGQDFEIMGGWIADESALISIMSDSREVVIALHQLIRAILWLHKEELSETYGIDQMVLSAQDVRPELEGGQPVALFVRQLHLRCKAMNSLSRHVGRISEIDLSIPNIELTTILTD